MIQTDRLTILPMTHSFISKLLVGDDTAYTELGIAPNDEWPSSDIKEILPFLLESLSPTSPPDGFGAWIIIDKLCNTIIGDGGFKGSPTENGVIDIGYSIIPSKRRRGFAYEAASALIQWSLSKSSVSSITADCSIDNAPSIALLKKLGMVEIARDCESLYYKLSAS